MSAAARTGGSAQVAEPLSGVSSPVTGSGLGTPVDRRSGWSAARLISPITRWLPRGGELPDAVWEGRHRHIVSVGYLLAIGCVLFATVRGYRMPTSLGFGALVALPAYLARNAAQRRASRSTVAALALLNACAVMIQAAGGATEAHFTFFVVIGLLTVYQDWSPFLVAIGYVVIHHGVMGTLMPRAVFDHASAWHGPWTEAAIHGGFILAASVTYVIAWRMNEQYQAVVGRYSEQLASSEQRFRALVQRSSDVTMVCDRAGLLSYVSSASIAVLGVDDERLSGRSVFELFHFEDQAALAVLIRDVSTSETESLECRLAVLDGEPRWAVITVTDLSNDQAVGGVVLHLRDVTRRRQLEAELRHSQKLESVGQLAAGIAHEINTPIQFVGDNLRFLRDAFGDQMEVLSAYRQAGDAVEARARAAQLELDKDCAYLSVEVPLAIDQTLAGVDRVATIVRAMKAFGHPSSDLMATTDLNEAIRNTLIVAGNVLKHTAEVRADFGELPMVSCHIGEINQVVLNLLVNASQAITEHAVDGELGRITVATSFDGADVMIEVTDSGGGIPVEVCERIFEPFFTTKEVGVGTGQGLSIAYNIIHDRHAGSITVSNTADGARFVVRLPVEPAERHGSNPVRPGPSGAELAQ